jgi:MraZ protein
MSAAPICSTATSSASHRKTLSCHGDGAFLKLDQDGRITMTDFIREHTGIGQEVAFVGRGQFFQIWEPGRLAEHGAKVRERLLKLRQAASGGPVQ